MSVSYYHQAYRTQSITGPNILNMFIMRVAHKNVLEKKHFIQTFNFNNNRYYIILIKL